MIVILQIVVIISLASLVCFSAFYFFNLWKLKGTIIRESPDLWKNARSESKLFESWPSTVYKLMISANKNGNDQLSSAELVKEFNKTKGMMYAATASFMCFLISALVLNGLGA